MQKPCGCFFRVCTATLHAADRKKIVHFEVILIVFPRVESMPELWEQSMLEIIQFAVGRWQLIVTFVPAP